MIFTDLSASLDRTRTRTELTNEVKDKFAEIGQCWVKVRFDKKNIPAAFVQFKVRARSNFRAVTICWLTYIPDNRGSYGS